MVVNRDKSANDYEITFMHASFPTSNYHWSQQNDKCFIPENHVVCIIGAPVTPTGHQYHLQPTDISRIQANI